MVFTAIDEQYLRMDASPACASVLVLSDNWYPRMAGHLWTAADRVLRADAAIQAIAIPAGSHRVEMRYRPSASFGPATLSLVTLAVVSVCGTLAGWGIREKLAAPGCFKDHSIHAVDSEQAAAGHPQPRHSRAGSKVSLPSSPTASGLRRCQCSASTR